MVRPFVELGEMSMATAIEPMIWTAVNLVERFGPIPLDRIRTTPPPGQATEQDAIELTERKLGRFELVGGTLVEKGTGLYELVILCEVMCRIANFVRPRRLGVVLGESGMLRLAPGLIRIPDVAFLNIEKFPDGRFPRDAALHFAPDLAVEVISKGNTAKEMAEKLRDYFAAGSRLVWYVDPQKRQVEVFTSPESSRVVKESDVLDGGNVLAGFEMSLKELFAEMPRE
jgi:Uma2 family endonuclease